MQSIDGVCYWNIGMKRETGGWESMCVCVYVCGKRLFNTLRGREASSEESILNVFYPPLYRRADKKWVVLEGGDLHVWWWYLGRHLSDNVFSGDKKDSRMWRRGATTTGGIGDGRRSIFHTYSGFKMFRPPQFLHILLCWRLINSWIFIEKEKENTFRPFALMLEIWLRFVPLAHLWDVSAPALEWESAWGTYLSIQDPDTKNTL